MRSSVDQYPADLLPTSSSSDVHNDIKYEQSSRRATWDSESSSETQRSTKLKRPWPRYLVLKDAAEIMYLAIVLAHIIPILLLVLYAPRISSQLGENACLPNGDFIFPGTASIWNASLFFTITLPVMTTTHSDDSYQTPLHRTLSYSQAKGIDIVWDMVIGRCGQMIIAYSAYKVYSLCVFYVMESQPLPYETYSAVAFNTGKSISLVSFWKIACGCAHRFRTNWRGRRVFIAMLLSSAYIVAMPTLFAAMTGYSAVTLPFMEVSFLACNGAKDADDPTCPRGPGIGKVDSTFKPCGGPYPGNEGGFVPGWGIWEISRLLNNSDFFDLTQAYTGENITTYKVSRADMAMTSLTSSDSESLDPDLAQIGLPSYYNRYKADYEAAARDPRCQDLTSLDNCPPLAKVSFYEGQGENITNLSSPLLGLQRWGTNLVTGLPDVWLCKDLDVRLADSTQWSPVQWRGGPKLISNNTNPFDGSHDRLNEVHATCNSSADYEWGFSFLPLLIVCILQLLTVAILYSLWIEAKRFLQSQSISSRDKRQSQLLDAAQRPSTVSSVLAISTQIEKQFGEEARSWSSTKLKRTVWRGEKGMNHSEDIEK